MSYAPRIVPMLLVVAVVLLQVTIVRDIELFGASPDLSVLVIMSVALLTGSVPGAAVGFLGGLCTGLFTAVPLGPHAMLGTVVGYWAGRWGDVLVTDDHPAPPLIVGVAGTFVMQLGRPLIEFLVNPGVDTTRGMWTEAVVVTGLNAMLAVPVYLAVRAALRLGDDLRYAVLGSSTGGPAAASPSDTPAVEA